MKVQQSPQLANLLPPLDPEEAANLRERMLADRAPQMFPYCIVNGTNYQLDGHHRLPICVKEKIKFSWQHIEHISTIAEAIAWVKSNQLGRRNSSAEQKALLRRQRVQQMHLDGMSTGAIADAEGVSKATVKRDIEKSQVEPPGPPEQNGAPSPPKVTGKDGKTYPAKGKKRSSGPKVLTVNEWLSHWTYCNRGLDDFRDLFDEGRAGQLARQNLDEARASLNKAYDIVTNLQMPGGKEATR